METYSGQSPIRLWAEDDRPREKLLNLGKQTLSDSELLALLLGSGNKKHSAIDLARIILDAYSNDLNLLASAGVKDLMRFPGIGEAKAVVMAAAFELGARRKRSGKLSPRISTSGEAFERMHPLLGDLPHEEFWVLFLSRSNSVISQKQISKGGLSGTVVDPKVVFKMALDERASGMILVHNHPSGSLKPSQADLDLTKKLSLGGKQLEIGVLDHLIVTQAGYLSFADEGLL